jgi:hypothetical protein
MHCSKLFSDITCGSLLNCLSSWCAASDTRHRAGAFLKSFIGGHGTSKNKRNFTVSIRTGDFFTFPLDLFYYCTIS